MTAAAAIVAAATFAACIVPLSCSTSSPSSPSSPARPVVVVEHGAPVLVDVEPPARLDVHYGPDVEHVERVEDCQTSGGTLDVERSTCVDVDY